MVTDGAELAGYARAFERKVCDLTAHVDPEHLRSMSPLWTCVESMQDRAGARTIAARLFVKDVGAWPALDRLTDRNARLALLDGPTLRLQLCTLALARRPGVVRSCIARDARTALRRFLGQAFDSLMSFSHLSRAPHERVAHWTPTHWTCVGYHDWADLLQPDDAVLRRLACLSLSPSLPSLHGLPRLAPADLSQAQALELMAENALEWSC